MIYSRLFNILMKRNVRVGFIAPCTQPAEGYFVELIFSVLITLKTSSQHITFKSKEIFTPAQIFTCKFARTKHFSL